MAQDNPPAPEPLNPAQLTAQVASIAASVQLLTRHQEVIARNTRYTGLLSAMQQVEWHDPLMKMFAGQLMAMSSICDDANTREEQLQAFAEVKALLDVFHTALHGVSDRM